MTTPKRWIDDPTDADDFERAILRSELELDHAPPAGAERAVFERVMAVVSPVAPLDPGASGSAGSAAGGGAAGAGGLATGAATLGGLGKGFALGIFVSVAAATGSHLLSRSSTESNPAPPAPSAASASGAFPQFPGPSQVAAPPEPVAGEVSRPGAAVPSPRPSHARSPAEVPAPSEPLAPAPRVGSVATFPSEGAATSESRLKEEAASLRRARAELRAGALAQAFATLEASRRQFTAPELTQEREALAIELLYRSGERAAAAKRAQDFLVRYPESPHAAAVRAFAASSP